MPLSSSKQAAKPFAFGSRTLCKIGSPCSEANFWLRMHFCSLRRNKNIKQNMKYKEK
ncbi:hypothetical protein Hanom_Chr10g00931631 [Helianthus anomalus]